MGESAKGADLTYKNTAMESSSNLAERILPLVFAHNNKSVLL